MKRIHFLSIITNVLFATACKKDSNSAPFSIQGITTENYPKVDCSTSALPLQAMMACKLLGIEYSWMPNLAWDGTYSIVPDYTKIPESFRKTFTASGTHEAFINLIDKKADLIITARKMSEDEKTHAASAGVTLIEKPIALDAFIFITHTNNPVNSLTTKQIQDIYTGKTTNWSQVGGTNNKIQPFIRDANSGSQELMESLVMKDLQMIDWPEAILTGMMGPFSETRSNVNALCYTVYYYKEQIVRDDIVKSLAVEGISPNKKNITNRTYPFTAEVYAVIRTDADNASMTKKIFDELSTDAGKNVINESGYIPY